jgi:chorismate mutase/prephenate dehydratase
MPRLMSTPDKKDDLAPLRVKIDDLDKQIVQLLNQRAKVVVDIGQIKRTEDSPIYAPDREQKVLRQVRQYNDGPLQDSCLEAIWRELMSGSFALEKPLRIGYLGPAGSFSHLAARRKFGANVEYDNLEDIAGVFEQVARGHIDLGLVPIENSAIGGIGETLDCFLDSPLHICAEVLINVHHNLLSNCSANEVKVIYSKPEVFSQCRKWLSMQLKQAQRVPVASTSKAAERAAGEEGAAAIGSSMAADLYKLHVQFENIEDNPTNVTRFFVISKQMARRSDDDKTAIMFTTSHKAGALVEVLDVFRSHGLNLTHIDTRPSQRVNWEYVFFIDFLGHQEDANVTEAVEEAQEHCLQMTILGSFPRAKDVMSY